MPLTMVGVGLVSASRTTAQKGAGSCETKAVPAVEQAPVPVGIDVRDLVHGDHRSLFDFPISGLPPLGRSVRTNKAERIDSRADHAVASQWMTAALHLSDALKCGARGCWIRLFDHVM